MRVLESPTRTLERPILQARELAEEAADKALQILAVREEQPRPAMAEGQRRLRVQLRAMKRRLGSDKALVEACAYEHWHRMLFARFLAENELLIHPEYRVPLSLDECAELAREAGEDDPWVLAAQFAAGMLPGVFPQEDPLLAVTFAAEDRIRLEEVLERLPAEVFTADDGLGWAYQFWQSKRKAEVNESGHKIGGEDLPAVTQLFTEPYMVQFLLQNSLGAWWAARHPGEDPPAELEYLRRLEDGTPAAGAFPGWPATARELRILDPCCGSGHFLIAAFALMVRLRMCEEGLSESEAGDAVLRDNLFGLEIDPRCTQIAAFGLALAAWKRGGYRPLSPLNIACSGLPLGGTEAEWVELAGNDGNLQNGLRSLYRLFQQAPDLGSLIDPVRDAADVWVVDARDTQTGNLFAASPEEILPALERALQRERARGDETAGLMGVAAQGAVLAANLLAAKYHLIATNVPYLARGKQDKILQDFCSSRYRVSQADLATAFLERCKDFATQGGAVCVVTPQNWLFLGRYKSLREALLQRQEWCIVARLGENSFSSPQAAGAFTALVILANRAACKEHSLYLLDVSEPRTPSEKELSLRRRPLEPASQVDVLRNPDARIAVTSPGGGALLSHFAISMRGIVCGDIVYWTRCFWEVPVIPAQWQRLQSTVTETQPFGGREHIINWSTSGQGMLRPGTKNEAYRRQGVAVSLMRELPATLYSGELYDNNTGVLVPHDPKHVPAIWAFCKSTAFNEAVRRIDQKLNVTNATLVKVPFDLEYWQAVAEKAGPLPEPHSEDPTQWLFQGNVKGSESPLHVAAARLLGYRWPEQPEGDALAPFADSDGIACLPAVRGERPAVDRLSDLLAAAYGGEWGPAKLDELLAGVDYRGKSMEEWLRDAFFEQHARRFHNRPFLWHIWDGRKDGFSAIVNYHRLDRANLERLTYVYLGEWIRGQKDDVGRQKVGAEARLAAAEALQKKLAAILEGENPYDIYVRWKPKAEQPLGWEPDLNDGVRLNIRPFVTAGVLRSRVSVKWNKDRGREPDGSERINDIHLSLEEKRRARGQ